MARGCSWSTRRTRDCESLMWPGPASLAYHHVRIAEQFRFAEMFQDEALQSRRVGGQEDVLVFVVVCKGLRVGFEVFMQPIVIAAREFQFRGELRHVEKQMAGIHGT